MVGTNKALNFIGATVLILLFAVAADNARAADEPPTVRSVAGFEFERPADSDRRDITKAETLAASAAAKAGTDPVRAETICCGHYIYAGFTELFDDIDGDGYFSYLRVNVDIDTDYFASDLYLKVFLRGSFDRWTKIYESNVFTINGTSSFDDYEIETELVSGFPADHYDVLVEVFDAPTGQKLIAYGPVENSSFSLRPMEDVNRDGATTVRPIVSSVGSSGGGSLSPAVIGFVVLLVALRALRTRGRPARSRARRAP